MAEPEHIEGTLDTKLENLNSNQDESAKPKHGGPRPNSGRKKGKFTPEKLEAMKVKEAFTQRVLKHADRLFNAQMALAVGEQVLMVKVTERGPKGAKTRVYHEQVTDMATIKEFLDDSDGMPTNLGDDDRWYYLSTRPANNQALDSLINRALGKVPETIDIGGGFFSQNELIIKVVGSKHDDINIGEDGQIRTDDTGTDAERAAGPSDSTPEPPASS